ncbi:MULTISPECIES: hypothetical protein [Kitasatospora]|uniref:Uncharacterized protein n=1 Tax=Kitasatospora cathayae TaxID=3004092 RepID=A0ABY7PXA2_9ACTN|nr:hypothetical protein [Kitasatospora sp. HUAS 3-15]WBP84980.1 hypothetical protein O1G21_03355 [Kitasatospora sp. HUAS 3-15]
MGLPLVPGHVLVRLTDGAPQDADAVLDALEVAFPTHTGRGRTRIGNVWDVPPTLTSEGSWTVAEAGPDGTSAIPVPGPAVSTSQAFDVQSPAPPPDRPALTGEATAELLGAPEHVETMLRALTALCRVDEENREEQGPQLAVRLRLRCAAADAG